MKFFAFFFQSAISKPLNLLWAKIVHLDGVRKFAVFVAPAFIATF
jgi:hypothetical protein